MSNQAEAYFWPIISVSTLISPPSPPSPPPITRPSHIELAQLGPLHFFGEMSLLVGACRSATATSLTYVECVSTVLSIFTHTHTHTPSHTRICTDTRTHIHIHTYETCTHTRTRTRTLVHALMRPHVHTHT